MLGHIPTYIYVCARVCDQPVGLGKQVLSTPNILVRIMAPISCSVCVIQNFVEFLIYSEEILDTIQITDKNKKFLHFKFLKS